MEPVSSVIPTGFPYDVIYGVVLIVLSAGLALAIMRRRGDMKPLTSREGFVDFLYAFVAALCLVLITIFTLAFFIISGMGRR